MTVLYAGLNGFVLGASLIIAIGAQNAFVLRQGLKRQFVFTVCLICALSDALLITGGVAGLGALVSRSQTVLTVVTAGGTAFLFVYGLQAFIRATRPDAMAAAQDDGGNLSAVIAACLAFTFLNPHVYLDTVLLLGSLSGRYEGTARVVYGAGAALSSFAWFFSLGYGARLLQPLFASRRAWQVLDVGIGLVMWLIAGRLLMSLFA